MLVLLAAVSSVVLGVPAPNDQQVDRSRSLGKVHQRDGLNTTRIYDASMSGQGGGYGGNLAAYTLNRGSFVDKTNRPDPANMSTWGVDCRATPGGRHNDRQSLLDCVPKLRTTSDNRDVVPYCHGKPDIWMDSNLEDGAWMSLCASQCESCLADLINAGSFGGDCYAWQATATAGDAECRIGYH